MLTMRPIDEGGSWGGRQKKVYILDDNGNKIYDPVKKTYKCSKVQTTDWNERCKAEEWRAAWADAVNAHLGQNGFGGRVDHRSYERQGVELVPTVRMGVAASQMERKGIRTERGDFNRQAEITNREIRQLRARIDKASDWLHSVPLSAAPSLVEMASGVQGGELLKSHWQKIKDLKARANVLMFLQENNIGDIDGLAAAVKRIHEKQYEVGNKLRKVRRRIDTLELHLSHCDNLEKHKAVCQKYQRLEPKRRATYYQKHGGEIEKYKSAKEYLDAVMNGKSPIPVKDWRKELSDKTAENNALYEEFYKLKGDVKNVEVLRRNAERIMAGQMPEKAQEKTRGNIL
jgi:hypothetical protein